MFHPDVSTNEGANSNIILPSILNERSQTFSNYVLVRINKVEYISVKSCMTFTLGDKTYRSDTFLFTGGSTIFSSEGTTQGDPL